MSKLSAHWRMQIFLLKEPEKKKKGKEKGKEKREEAYGMKTALLKFVFIKELKIFKKNF